MLRADETDTEPDDLLVPTADDAVEKDRLERAPVEGNEAGAGDAGAAGRSRLFPPAPFLTLLLKQRKRKQAIAWSKRRRRGSARGGLPPRLHHRLHHRAQNRDGNEQHKLLKSKPIKGNKILRHKTFLVGGAASEELRLRREAARARGSRQKIGVQNRLTAAGPR